MKRVRLITALIVAGSAGVGFVPIAQASTTTIVTPTKEAWYQPNPTCAQASGCVTPGALPVAPPAEIPLSPYPAGTMHIGFAGGQETARSYLALPLDTVTGTLESATLTVPVDIAEASGSATPEASNEKIQACLFTTDIQPVEGSIGAPPTASCDSSAPVKYVATPSPHLEADLGPLTQGLLTTAGIVLLPNQEKVAPTDAFRVVFSSHTRSDTAKTPPATVTLTLADEEDDDEPDFVGLPTEDSPGLSGVAPPVGTGFAPSPEVETPTDTGSAPNVAPPVAAPTQPVVQPQTVTVGYAYPAVWLLPLAFLVLVPLAARALTRDLLPA